MELFKTWLFLAFVAGSYAAPFSTVGRQCSRQTCNSEQGRYEVGKKYTYHYNAKSETWINGTSEQKSSLQFDCQAEINVLSPCELALSLKDVAVYETNANGERVTATNEAALRNELQEHILRFAFIDGVVTDVCPVTEEKTWALNFKRGFLSAIQAPVTEVDTPVTTTETDVTGKCPVVLKASEYPGSIKKYKDFQKCEQHVKIEGGIRATMLKSEAPTFNILECLQECEVTFHSNIVSETVCTERHMSKAFSKQRSGAVTLTTVIVDELVVSRATAAPDPLLERRTTILFDHEESKTSTEDEVLMKTKEILGSISRKLSQRVGKEMPNLFSDLVTEMRKIETTAAMTSLRQFAEGESESLFKVFKDALPMCETVPSVETMVTIINEVEASTDEEVKKTFKATRAMWLTFPSVISHPKKEMISALMPLIKTLSVEDTVFFLPTSSLINRYCTSENPSCLDETEVRQALEYFQQLLGFDCIPNAQVPTLKMLMALKALTNIRLLTTDSKISTINKCFDHHDPSKGMEIRIAALELVRRLPCKPVYQTDAKALYKNTHFDSELRIAAYRALMTCPSDDLMSTIQQVMTDEQSDQVASYVWTHLSNLNKTSDPQKQHLKKWVQNSGIMEPIGKRDLRKFSRNMELSWYNDEMASGLTIDSDMIFSSKSFFPRELKLNNTIEAFGYAINLFEIGGRLEGMHQIFESYLGPRGYLKENSVQALVEKYQQEQQQAFLDNLPDAGEVTLPEGLPEGVTLEMYTQLLRMLQFQQKMFGGQIPLPIPGEPMPESMPKGMTQEMYDELLVVFMRDGVPGLRKKRHLIKESSINDIESEFHANVENKPHASVYFKMFGNELAYLDIAKIRSRLMEIQSSMNPMKMLMNMAKDQTHELTTNAIVMDESWTLPMISGLPLKIAVNGTISMKVRTEGKIDMRGILMAPRSFEINGVIEPSAALEVSTCMEVMARQTRSGLNQVSRLHSSVSLGGKIQVTDGKAFIAQINIPDEKQEIIDVSSNIYLLVQDASPELEGIPERLEKSSCSGTYTTKYIGGQFCTEISFPKSFSKDEYPLFPLTGPSKMLVTLEKTDPSLTAWKLEGSYGLEKETVDGEQVKTDMFHLMFGTPDTSVHRTFQLDVSYNRNKKDLNLNVITPVKTLDIHSQVVNNELLRKLEVSVTLDKTDVYNLDTEVESRPSVVDGDPVITFYPRMDITSPKGLVVKYRSSIGVRDGQQTRVNMWMSLDSPRTSLVTVSGDVIKTESARKVRYSSDLQISGRYVNVNVSTAWQKQKRDNIITVDATVLRRVSGEIIKDVIVSAKYTNRTTEGRSEWDLKTEWAFKRYPLLSFLFETDYIGTSGSSESTSKLCYRYNGQECGQNTKVIMGHQLQWASSETSTNENLNFKIRNPANNINLEIQQHVIVNSSHPLAFSFKVVNNTSEMDVINAAVRTRILSEEPIKGDFEASLQSETWRYAALQDWEFSANKKAVLNTGIHWNDQRATLGLNFTPSEDEMGMTRYDFNSLLTYPLGTFSTSWYAWKKDNDMSHGASAFLIDQQLFGYKVDFINKTIDRPDVNLLASFNISRPMSPVSVMLHASQKDEDIDMGFNVTLGDVKAFTSGFNFMTELGEDYDLKRNMNLFIDVEIPQKDFSLSYRRTSTTSAKMSEDEQTVILGGKTIYYLKAFTSFEYNSETGQLDVIYDYTNNMSAPLPEYDYRIIVNVTNGNHNHKLVIHRNKAEVFFLKASYNREMLEADMEEQTDRHAVKIFLNTPLVILKDISWNGTLDIKPRSFNFDTRLLYFPNQEHPFVMTINYQNKSSDLVTHNQLNTTFESVKRRINIVNMAKFDLGSGIIIGSSSVEVGVLGTEPEKFDMTVEYTNKTEGESITKQLDVTFNSPDNTIKTEGILSYIEQTQYTTSFNILVSERSIFEVRVDARNDSDISQKSFDVDSNLRIFQEQFRVHMVHNQDANSFHPNIKVHLANENDPTAETDVLYTKTGEMNDVHTVIVTLKSKDIEPFKIQTTYTNGSTSQNVSVVISTSPDKHLDMKFDVATGYSNNEMKTCDVRFQVDNTYLPNRKFEVTAQYGNTDTQLNLNSVLKISDVQLMNIVYVLEHTSSEQQMRRDSDLRVTFPQMSADYPALSKLALRLITDVQDRVEEMRTAEMRWGQLTDDEAVVLQLTSRDNWWQARVNHPMDLQPLPKQITIVLRNDTVPTAIKSFEMTVDGEGANLMALAGSYSPTLEDENVREAKLTFTRPDQPDIEIKLQAQLLNENVVFGSELWMKYSEDEDRHVHAMMKVLNNTNEDITGYDVNFLLLHPVSNLDMQTALTLMNDKKMISAGLEGIFSGETTKPFNFEFSWNKAEMKYTVLSNTPVRKMLFTGQFEDRSYADFQIYRVSMTNTYNDDRIVRSMFEFNSQLEQISYIVHHNPDMPDDYVQFRAGFLNDTALVSLLESMIDGEYSVDARLLLALETPKILLTHLKWNPYWIEYSSDKMQQVRERMVEQTENLRGEMTSSHESLRERIQMSWDDFLLSNAYIKNNLEDMYNRFLTKYESRKQQLQQMQETMKTRSTDYWNELKEDLAPHHQNILNRMEKMKTKYQAWAAQVDMPAQEYIETMTLRVKDFYKKHIKPLFEELEELFENLKIHHGNQWDILSLQIRPIGDYFQMPMAEPKDALYSVGGSENVKESDSNPAEAILETSINVPGEKKISFASEDTILTTHRFQMLKIWQEIEKIWNETKAEFEAILAEIDAEFKQSNFYMDMTERLEELKLRFPIEQWRQEVEAKIDEIKESNEMQELNSLVELIKEELLVARNVTEAGLMRIRDRLAKALEGYSINFLEYFKRPTYEVVTYDLENGEILVRLHLQTEINSLKRMPETFYQVEMVRNMQKMMAEVRERSKNTLGEITMADGTVRSMYDLILTEPMLLYREGNISEWFQGERIKTMRKFWEYYHLSRLYLNPINWIPPHEGTAVIVGANHYRTFDHTFYDFSEGCSYLLAHDFIDGNFTVIVEYNRENNVERQKTIVLYLNPTTVFEIRSDSRVYHGKQLLELPLQYGNTTIMHHMNSVRIHNTNGVTITCDIAHDICNVNVSGWYFGKTAGLFGTYNYETKDDFTTSDNDMARHVDDFTRSWKVGKRCSGSSTDALPECNSDPEVEANLICSDNFLKPVSSLTECLGVVDPAPYYSMCTSRMCELSIGEKRQKEACQSIKAYVDECNRMNVNIGMPDFCVVCNSTNGKFTKGQSISLRDEDVVPKSADVVVIVEEKLCNENMRESISDIIDMYDSDLKNTQGFSDMRYGLLGFGGEGVHDLPHIHTIDGKVFNTKRAFILQGLPELMFAENGSKDTFAAILAAAKYPFRAGVAKNIILLSCSNCQRLYHLEKTYKDVASLLLRQGIQFNILMNSQLELVPTRAKNTSPKNLVIYGIDNRTVFTNKALSSGRLIGDKTLRKLVNEPMNQCALLAFESGGSLFDTSKIQQKKFMDVLTQRMIQRTVIEECQVCTCEAGSDWVGRAVCEPCHIARDYPWMFGIERTLSEAYYYSQHGMQSFVDYLNTPAKESTAAIDFPVNKTPKQQP